MTYDYRIAAVTLEEKGTGSYKVFGPYAEMQRIIPLLKKQKKWRYNGLDKSWESRDLGPRQLAKVKEALGLAPAAPAAKASPRVFNNFVEKALKVQGPKGSFDFDRKGEVLTLKLVGNPTQEKGLMEVLATARKAGAEGNYPYLEMTSAAFNAKAGKALLEQLSNLNAAVEEALKERAVAKALLGNMLPFQALGIRGKFTDTVTWEGATRPYAELFKSNKFRWTGSHWDAALVKGLPSRVEAIIDRLKSDAQEADQAATKLGLPQLYPNLEIRVFTVDGYIRFLGDLRKYKDGLYSAGLLWDGSYWEGNLAKVDVDDLQNVLKAIEADDTAETTDKGPAKVRRGRPNQRGDHCQDCGGWVEPGDGIIERVLDEDDDRMIWVVYHRDIEVCQQTKTRRRQQREEEAKRQQTKRQAERALRDYAIKQGKSPDPNNKRVTLKGRRIYLDETALAYGGGYWVVIEPGNQYFWYVINNGADGDDWSRNNVSTGGAGAIGYRVPLTEEAKQQIEIISGEKI